MPEIVNYKFISYVDNNKEVEINAKGYKDRKDDYDVHYFKCDHSYKFLVKENSLKVEFNKIIYCFILNEYTKCTIKTGEYSFDTKIYTKKLEIDDSKILVEYTMIFPSFEVEHLVILELR